MRSLRRSASPYDALIDTSRAFLTRRVTEVTGLALLLGAAAFTVALADLEAFEIDYIGKNLKIKVKKGRTYNFTDPDGNADRLFVFHRDVEKARDRLKKGDAAGQ